MSLRSGLALIAGALVCLPSAGQNLVTNGDFTSDLAGWSAPVPPAPPGTGSVTWDADSGSALAGALRIEAAANGLAASQQTRSPCIEVSTATLPLPWDVGGRRLQVTQVGTFCVPELAVVFYSGAGCTGAGQHSSVPVSGTVAGVLDAAPAVFTRLEGTYGSDPMPGLFPTASLQLAITASAVVDPTDECETVFDSVYFGGDGTLPVELVGFAVE